MEVCSAVSGETLAFLDAVEEKSAKAVKQALALRLGVPRFRQRLLLDDGSEIEGEVCASRVQLVILDFERAGDPDQD